MKARYDCSCRQDDSIIPDHLREGYSGFLIDLQIRHVLERANGDDPVVLGSFGELIQYHRVDFPTVEFMDGVVAFSLNSCTKVNIPDGFILKVARQVMSLAKSMSNNADNGGIEKVMPISVKVVVRNWQEPQESEQEAIARAFSECADDIMEQFYQRASASDNVSPTYLEFVNSRKSSLKALEYVRLEDLSSAKCGICRDKLSVGRLVACRALMCFMRTVLLANLKYSITVPIAPLQGIFWPNPSCHFHSYATSDMPQGQSTSNGAEF